MERYRLSDVARIYGVQEITIKRWVHARKLNGVNLGGANRAGPYIFRPEDLEAFEAARPIFVPAGKPANKKSIGE